MKDPAFLFYSKDFYEGTRMMLPAERACYVDLLIYQHQNGAIPNDPKRVLMYCSGVDEATLIATLEAKFKLTSEGWINERLETAILQRESFKNERSSTGKVGQFWKKAYKILAKTEIKILKSKLSKQQIINFLENVDDIDESTLKALLKLSLSNKAIVNANGDAIANGEKGGVGEKTEGVDFIPTATVADFLLSQSAWFEQVAMNCKLKPPELQAWALEYQATLQNRNEAGKTRAEAQRHFANWLKLELEKKRKNNEKSVGHSRKRGTEPSTGYFPSTL